MANVTNNFGSFAAIDTAGSTISGGFGLASALTWAQAAYDNAYYYAAASYTVTTSSQVSGTLNNIAHDQFNAIGTNLLGYPHTTTRLDYLFVQSGVSASLSGSVSSAYAGASQTGSVNKIEVSQSSYGKVTIQGYDNVAVYGDGTISNVTWEKNGVVLTASGSLTGYTYAGTDGYYHAVISGNYTSMSLSSIGQTIQISGLSVDANAFAGITSADVFFSSVLSGADQVTGSSGSEVLFGYGGADVINAGSGTDTLTGGLGNDTLAGDTGTDTAVFSGVRSGYSITPAANGYAITDINSSDGNDGTDTITGVELLQFFDRQIDLTVNAAPTGVVNISGTPTEGQALTVSNTLADADGLGTIGYQWKADGNPIIGATANTFLLTGVDVGKALTVSASYTDGHGTTESVTSTPTAIVAGYQSGTTSADNLIGTSYADTLLGLVGNDTLTGGAGNDNLDGGAGYDVAQYSGNKADYTITQSAWYHYTVTDVNTANGDDGIDTLFAIEQIQFADSSSPLQTSGSWHGIIQKPTPPFWAGTDWNVVESQRDFNDDGKNDVLLGKPDGSVSLWLMDGSTRIGGIIFDPSSGRTLVEAAADYNADGKTDLKWHEANGSNSYWLFGSGWAASATAPPIPTLPEQPPGPPVVPPPADVPPPPDIPPPPVGWWY